MPERDALAPTPPASSGAPATPRVSGEAPFGAHTDTPLPAESSTRAQGSAQQATPSEPGAPSAPSDTLLSAGKPADRLELLLEDRLAVVDERLRELDTRLNLLERTKPLSIPESRQKPWLWLALLIGLVILFQLLHTVR